MKSNRLTHFGKIGKMTSSHEDSFSWMSWRQIKSPSQLTQQGKINHFSPLCKAAGHPAFKLDAYSTIYCIIVNENRLGHVLHGSLCLFVHV